MTSVIPQNSTNNLWAVLYPIGFEHVSSLNMLIDWSGPENDTLFESGGTVGTLGDAHYPGLVWDRYLGPSALKPGTHYVTVRDDSGRMLARRSFEIVGSMAGMSSAKRLEIIPQYFELLAEPGAREGMDSVMNDGFVGPEVKTTGDTNVDDISGLTGSTNSAGTEDVLKLDPASSGSHESSKNLLTYSPSAADIQRDVVQTGSAATRMEAPVLEDGMTGAAHAAAGSRDVQSKTIRGGRLRQRLSSDEVQRRERDWITHDVQRFAATKVKKAGGGGQLFGFSGKRRARPQTKEERWLRELEWLRKDVELHVPADKLRRQARSRSASSFSEERLASQIGSTRRDVRVPSPGDTPPQTPLPTTTPVLEDVLEGVDQEDLRKREAAWIQKEAERMHRVVVGRMKATASLPTDSTLSLSTSHISVSPSATSASHDNHLGDSEGHVRRKPMSPEERDQREEEWIKRDIDLHVPPSSQARFACRARSLPLDPPVQHSHAVDPWHRGSNASIDADEAEELSDAARRRVDIAPVDNSILDVRPLRSKVADEPRSEEAHVALANRNESINEPNRLAIDDADKLAAVARDANLSMEAVLEARLSLRDRVPEEVIDRELPWILRDIAIGRRSAELRLTAPL
eukprot:TRINITY_DN23927_c0_g1_i2.p1 TRINITY_DN23927_c0_g1~~TRINITY_DN23927_c0_g1_i2.p1  ORF type:complete len:716 (-),score=96.77 TRINITY_DN23927_c0_g1_i2:230-2119(-)